MLNKRLLTVLLTGYFPLLMGCTDTSSPLNSQPEDLGVIPKIDINLSAPMYLSTNVIPNIYLDVTINGSAKPGVLSPRDVHQWISKNSVLETFPGKKLIAGDWKYNDRVGGSTRFTPSGALEPGDYLLHFPKASDEHVIKPRPYNLFRVGSALRLREIGLVPDKSASTTSNGSSLVELIFSEALPQNEQVTVQINKKAADDSWLPLASTKRSDNSIALAQTIDPKVHLRFVISSPSLDGKWTGKAGSGPLEVEFLPSDYQVPYTAQIQYFVIPEPLAHLPQGTSQ